MQKLISQLSILGLLAQISLSWQLWFPENRSFPLLPILNFPGEAFPFSEKAFGLLIVAAALLNLLFPLKKWAIACLISSIFLAVLADLTRLQTWVWFYVLVFSALFFPEKEGRPSVNSRVLLLFCAIYFWGGLNKMNPYFSTDIFPWFCEGFALTKPFADKTWAAWLAAAGETALAFGLFFQKTRPVFRWLAVAFHLYIALIISPLALNWNHVVIPWNLVMAAILILLPSRFDNLLKVVKPEAQTLFFIFLAAIAPAFNIVHCWPENLSWKMYSGTHGEFTFYFSEGFKKPLPENVAAQIFGKTEKKLLLDDWAMAELKAPPFDVVLTEKLLAEKLCPCVENADSAGHFLMKVGHWSKSGESIVKVPCKQH